MKGEYQMSKYEAEDVDPRKLEVSRRRFLRNAGMAAAALPMLGGLAEVLSETGASGAPLPRDSSHPLFAPHKKYKFAMVNHVTTNPFFTPTIYGCQDACNILKSSFSFQGSQNSIVSQMVSAMNSAIGDKVAGIGVCLIDNSAFTRPVDSALNHGIPVIAYNADVGPGFANNRMAYIGQSNLSAGAAAAKKILASGVKKGQLVGGVIATPGTGNIQPRIDGARSVFKPAGVDFVEVGTSATTGSPEYDALLSWYNGHKDVKFLYSVDSGDSVAVAQLIQNLKLKGKVGGSGWDVQVPVLDLVRSGALSFTIDQQAYLQGFVTIVQLFLYQVSGGLMKPCDTDTGLGFVTKSNVAPYLSVKSRFEGTSSAQKTLTPPKKIGF